MSSTSSRFHVRHVKECTTRADNSSPPHYQTCTSVNYSTVKSYSTLKSMKRTWWEAQLSARAEEADSEGPALLEPVHERNPSAISRTFPLVSDSR